MASSGALSLRCRKRRSSRAASLACHSASPKTSLLMAPAKAQSTSSFAIARATFQVEPPTWLSHCDCAASCTIMSVSASPAATNRGKPVILILQHIEHFVARAHGVVIDLAGRAFLVGQFAVVRTEDAVPGAVLVVDEMLPAVAPDFVVPGPVARLAGAVPQQR